MGYVTCGRHGVRCCWRCDECPKCSGKFQRVGRGDYCPTCREWFKVNGWVWLDYTKNYHSPEHAAQILASLANEAQAALPIS